MASFGSRSIGDNEPSITYISGLPDPSSLNDSQMVVVFKNLLKKDTTTREKAITELTTLLSTEKGPQYVDTEFHWAWTLIYPKLSIDVSRNVRQQSHKAHGIVFRILGKNSAKYLKDSVSPWLCGMYDTDKLVAAAADHALDLVFPTEEKKKSLYKIFEKTLIDYIYEVIALHTPEALSDERYVSKEEAEAKYLRTVRSCIALLRYLLLNGADCQKYEETYKKIVSSKKLWRHAASPDVLLSKSVLELVIVLVNEHKDWAEPNLKVISHYVIYKGFNEANNAVLIDVLQANIVLARAFPESFNLASSKEGAAYSALLSFVSQGSRRSGKHFWPLVQSLLSSLSSDVSPYSSQSPTGTSEGIAQAYLDGIQKEMVVHLAAGWGSYLTAIKRIVSSDVSPATADAILNSAIEAVARLLILQEGDTLDREILQMTGKKLAELWQENAMTMKDKFSKLLDEIALNKKSRPFFKKYFFTTKVMFDDLSSQAHKDMIMEFMVNYLKFTFNNLAPTDEDFQIYSVSLILSTFEDNIFSYDKDMVDILEKFLKEDLAKYIVSDSAADVINILKQYTIHNKDPSCTSIQQFVELSFNSVVKLSNLDQRSSLFPLILKEYALFRGRTKPIPLASEYLLSVYSSIDSWEITNDWDSILFGISSHGIFVAEDVAFDILKGVSSLQLVSGKNIEKAIWTFGNLLKLDRPYFMKFIETEAGKVLVSQLWKLSEDYPEAEGILGAIEDNAIILPRNDVSLKDNKTLQSLTDGLLSEVERSSVDGIDLSVQRGQRLLDQTQDAASKLQLFEKLLFYPNGQWSTKLASLFESGVAGSLAVSNPLGGALFFLDNLRDETQVNNLKVIPEELIAMSIFSVCLIANNRNLFETLPKSVQLELMTSLGLISEASTDYAFLIEKDQENGIDDNFLSDAIIAFSKDVSAILLDGLKEFTAHDAVAAITNKNPGLQESHSANLISQLWNNTIEHSTKGYYSARVLSFILEYLVERPTITRADAESLFAQMYQTVFDKDHILGAAAVMLGFKRFSLALRAFDKLRNQFASELVSLGNQNVVKSNFKSLVYLNLLLDSPMEELKESEAELFPVQRLQRCLQSLFECMQSEDAYSRDYMPARMEISKLLSKVLPLYPGLPTELWQSAVELLEQDFIAVDENSVGLEYFTLKLFNTLVHMQESHADLSEIWLEKQSDLYAELHDVLFKAKALANQAREMTNVQLLRAVSTTPLNLVEDPEQLYGLLAVPSFEIQRCAYILLHQLIPSQQEERSIELQLQSQKLATDEEEEEEEEEDGQKDEDEQTPGSAFTLPVELVSLLLETPVRGAPACDLTRYLWSWMLIYDHFHRASYDLRRIYINELRECGHLETFLNFISEKIVAGDLQAILDGHRDDFGDLMKSYGSRDEEFALVSEEIDVLMLHLYYLALQHTGSLVKAWYLSVKKRQVTIALEKFTEKYISPTIVNDEMDSVESMLREKRDGLLDEQMKAKIIRPLREVRVYYTIDEQTMEISISYPSLYPLKDIRVEGIKRIGVKEKQWRAWLMASQAIGTSQNGTIVDILELFKRNVSLHFEGAAECAICYSILHQDHTLPTKVCPTCKNKFHNYCLYKWFSSATTSTCPLCRNEFSFRRNI
ncbi:E3 ubiquitin-protein ligase listerin [Trichomonascus vanleenenianus]|uniref:ubiquitin-protein ligase RKR1 n=1 Tax=Trichomonascus vanleenenianus TaxID=2268995 RepID=UPI003ECADC1F